MIINDNINYHYNLWLLNRITLNVKFLFIVKLNTK